MSRALIIHGHFHDLGGAEHFCFRIAGILQNRFNDVVVLHTGASPDLALIEQRTGIRLSGVRFESVKIPFPIRRLTRGDARSLALLQYAFVVRFARKIASGYDLVVSTFAECSLRQERMIQNIHIPMMVSDTQSLEYCGLHMRRTRRWAQVAYIILVKLLAGKMGLVAKQKTVTNSEWTARQFLRHYPGADVRALYHGVDVSLDEASTDWIPFETRANRLTMIGRVAPSKRIEDGIHVAEELRKRGHDVGLDIVGNGSGEYFEKIRRLAAARPWIGFHDSPGRSALEHLAARNKGGLHCYHCENSGLAPGELQALGCICFVHDSGGQREIITDPRQRYTSLDDAIAKIDSALRSSELQKELLARAKLAADRHRGDAFGRNFQALIDTVLTAQKDSASATGR